MDGPSLVLGSSQPLGLVDSEKAAAAGVAVARRRSGGGAVYLSPGRQVWIDLLVPRGDRLWDDDVIRAAIWAGETWSAAVASLTGEPASVHRGRSAGGRWGRLICFAGLGPAEVTVGGRKVVGISQRRSRDWTRIQTMARIAPDEDAPTPSPASAAGAASGSGTGEGSPAPSSALSVGAASGSGPALGAVPGSGPTQGTGSDSARSGAAFDEAALLALTEDERSRVRAVVAARSGSLAAGPEAVVEAFLSLLPN